MSFRENGKLIREFEVAYFTASCDKEEVNAKFAKSLELDYPILSDPTCKTAQAYGMAKPPLKFPKRWTFFIGKDGKILAIDKGVKTKEHGKAVAEKLAELGVAKRAAE